MIRRGIDYVYSANLPAQFMWPNGNLVAKHFASATERAKGWTAGERSLMMCSTGDLEEEGNTGLHYLRAGGELSIPLMEKSIARCAEPDAADDQVCNIPASHSVLEGRRGAAGV